MIGDEKTHYEVLGVDADAPSVEINRAARRLMRKHHPDRGGDASMAARINTAYAVLSNPGRREQYDNFLHTDGHGGEDEPPDPDAYEDEWGSTDEWEDPDDEEEVNIEVEDDPPAPRSDATGAQDDPAPTTDAPTPRKPTKVRTALQRALLLGLLPTVLLNLIVFAESYIVTDADAWTLFPAIGTVVGLLIPLVLRARLPQTPSPQASTATLIAMIFVVAGLGFIAQPNPLAIPLLQNLVATSLGLWVFISNATHHRLAERIISAKGLREDGTLFGPSTGDTSGELLTSTVWKCLSRPEMHAARAFQTADAENPFTKAVLLGNRVALIRPVFIPDSLIPAKAPSFYWSPPSLFLQGGNSNVPTPIIRLDLGDYRTSFKNVAGQLTTAEFLVFYTTSSAPRIVFPAMNPQMPTITTGADAADAICSFLLDTKTPVEHVDHISAATALMGLEYRLMNG